MQDLRNLRADDKSMQIPLDVDDIMLLYASMCTVRTITYIP